MIEHGEIDEVLSRTRFRACSITARSPAPTVRSGSGWTNHGQTAL